MTRKRDRAAELVRKMTKQVEKEAPNAGPKILIVSASVGAGHVRAADAVKKAIEATGFNGVVEHWDILNLMPRPFTKGYREGYFKMLAVAPQFYGWLYDATDRPFKQSPVKTVVERRVSHKFRHAVRDFNPSLVISTHFLPTTLLSAEKAKGHLNCVLTTVVTDVDVHGQWLVEPSDHYFVAVPEARALLELYDIPANRITVSGIPTDPVFTEEASRPILAKKHQIRPDLPTILFSAGGFGLGGNVSAVIEGLVEHGVPAQLLVVCGKNPELLKSVSRVKSSKTTIVKPIGFTNAMHELMACSDLVMGKPGGLTSWESFHQGLGWIIVNPIPGQEERNSTFLLEAGAAIRCHNLHTLPFKVKELLGNPSKLASMKRSAKALAKPGAGMAIATGAMRLADLH